MLDHVVAGGKSGKAPGKMRLSIWPNANFIRYTMAQDLQEPGSIQFTRLIEVGLTRDGESLGAGATSSSSEPAKCIVTGGAATTTVSYQGRTFPVCCSGCRDEFNENPEKYIKKASLIEAARTAKSGAGRRDCQGSQPIRGRVRGRRRRQCRARPSRHRVGSSKSDDESRSGRRIHARWFRDGDLESQLQESR